MKRTGREDRLRRQPQLAHGDPHPHRHQYRPQADQGRPFPLSRSRSPRNATHPSAIGRLNRLEGDHPPTVLVPICWHGSCGRARTLCSSAQALKTLGASPRSPLASAAGATSPPGQRPRWMEARRLVKAGLTTGTAASRRVLVPRTRRVKLIGRRRENATAASPWT